MTRWIRKTALEATPVLASTVIVLVVGSLLPPLAAWALVVGGPLVMVALLAGVGEPTAVAVFHGARRPRPEELVTLEPSLALLLGRGNGPDVRFLRVRDGLYPIWCRAVGRRTVIVSDGLIAAIREGVLPVDQAAAVIAHGAGVVRSGATRNDLAIAFWCMPFTVIAAFTTGLAAPFARLPLVALVWRARFVVGGVTLFQGIQDGRPGAIVAGGLGAAVIALTYLIPRLRRGWEANLTAIGDLWIQQSGMSQPYAAFLRRCPHTPATAERILALDPPRDTWPHPIQQTTGSSHGRPSPP